MAQPVHTQLTIYLWRTVTDDPATLARRFNNRAFAYEWIRSGRVSGYVVSSPNARAVSEPITEYRLSADAIRYIITETYTGAATFVPPPT